MNGCTLTAAQLDTLRALDIGADVRDCDQRTTAALFRKGCLENVRGSWRVTDWGRLLVARADKRAERRIGGAT